MPRDSTSNNFDQLSHDYDKRLSNSEHPPDDWHYPSRNIDENSQIIYQGYLFKQVRTRVSNLISIIESSIIDYF